jgi:serpin B
VDEKGTEAAAATGTSMVSILAIWADAPVPIPFTADHPFYYAIRNNQTGAIIFSGAMVTPQS